MAAAAALVLAAVPAGAAEAKHTKKKRSLPAATIVTCDGDTFAVRASVRPPARKAMRSRVSGAVLELRFDAVPLFGELRRGSWVRAGRKPAAVRQRAFQGLPADVWRAAVRYRWRKGGRTVARGTLRTRRTKVGKRRGHSTCTLATGRPPVDRTPPGLFVLPASDDTWRNAPVGVQVYAADDLSGVAAVNHRVDGGPVGSGRSFTVAGDGARNVEVWARDVAGNVSPVERRSFRIDTTPPATPAIAQPPASTSDNTPPLAWSASSDAASGLRGYVVVVRNSARAIVWSAAVGPGTASLTLPRLANGSYTAQVVAYDGAEPVANFAASAERGFTVTNLVYTNGFSSAECADWNTTATEWTCGDSSSTLRIQNPKRCPSPQEHPVTSQTLSYVAAPGDLMTVSFIRNFVAGNSGDEARVEVRDDSDNVIAQSSADSVVYTEPATKPKIRFVLSLAGGGEIGCLLTDSNSSLTIDDLQIVRDSNS